MPGLDRTENYLLGSLSKDDFALLKPHLAETRLVQKTVLQEANSPIDYVYFPIQGMISLLATFETGEAIEIAAIGREGAIGTKVGFPPQLSFARAVVQLPGSAYKIAASKFQDAALSSRAIMHIVTCANDVLLTNLQQSAGCNALHGVEARLARWLLLARDRFDSDDLPLSHEFLAQMLGTRRTTVSLAAHTLQAAGVISYKRAKVQIKDREALEAISCECYNAVRRNVELIARTARLASRPPKDE
jgi:CRP-like cAMP-binding protein